MTKVTPLPSPSCFPRGGVFLCCPTLKDGVRGTAFITCVASASIACPGTADPSDEIMTQPWLPAHAITTNGNQRRRPSKRHRQSIGASVRLALHLMLHLCPQPPTAEALPQGCGMVHADSMDMSAYQTRYVALEVAYLGGRYNGLASQANTEQTVEVRAMTQFVLCAITKGTIAICSGVTTRKLKAKMFALHSRRVSCFKRCARTG